MFDDILGSKNPGVRVGERASLCGDRVNKRNGLKDDCPVLTLPFLGVPVTLLNNWEKNTFSLSLSLSLSFLSVFLLSLFLSLL